MDQQPTEEDLKNMSPEELAAYQKANCLFCKIINKEIDAKTVYEDESTIGILDINPAAPGHVLVMPKEHHALLPQIPEDVVEHLFQVGQHISSVMLRSLDVKGTTVFVANGAAAGQRAPHFIYHIIPRKEKDGLFPPPTQPLPEQQRHELNKLTPALEKVFGKGQQILQAPVVPETPEEPEKTDEELDAISNLFE